MQKTILALQPDLDGIIFDLFCDTARTAILEISILNN